MSSLLKTYLSMEDNLPDAESVEMELGVEIPAAEPVTEVEELEAEAVIDEADGAELEAAQSLEEFERVLDEVDGIQSSLENYTQVLAYGIETGEYSPQFAAVVHASIEEYGELFGREGDVLSLENYGHDQLDQYYKLSMESFAEFLKKVGSVRRRVTDGAVDKMVDAVVVGHRKRLAASILKKADAVIAKLEKIEGNNKATVNLKGLHNRLAVNGQFPSNLVQAAKADAAAMNEVFTKYTPAAFKHNEFLGETVGRAIAASTDSASEGRVSQILTAIASTATPESKLSEGIRKGTSLLGNKKLGVDEVAPKNDELRERLQAIFKSKVKGFVSAGDKVTTPESVSMSKSDVLALLQVAKAYSVIIEKANDSITTNARNLKVSVFRQVENWNRAKQATTWKESGELAAAVRVMYIYPHRFLGVVSSAFGHSSDSAKALIKLAERATAELGKGGE